MKHLFTLFIILGGISWLNAQTLNGPESIEHDAAHNRYLISNSDNGQILARAANGSLSVFKSGINPSPYGLEILGNTIYACCGGFIKGYDLETGNLVFNLNLGATFLNGITTDGISNLFATDFTAKKIYRIKPASNSFNVMASNLVQSPNGICYDQANNRLVFVNWGSNAPIKSLSLSDSLVLTLATTNLGSCDGIVWNGLDTWYVTAWTGQKVMKFDANFSAAPILVANGLNSPADIDYNIDGDTLAIPNSGNNTLTFIGFPPIVNVNCSLLPLQVLESQIEYNPSSLSFGNYVIQVPLLNLSGLGFAYPLARLRVQGDLPEGMAFGNNQDGFSVFASAWNNDSTAIAEFYFDVSDPIAPNTLLNFEIDVTNLTPSSADTCYFTQTFTVNLNPDNTVGYTSELNRSIQLYPNPSADKIFLQLPELEKNWTIEIYSTVGNKVAEFASKSNSLVDLSAFSSGIYFIRFQNQNLQYLRRFVKQ
jgi:hypothetical protein